MFPVDGMFLDSKDSRVLFNYVCPKILELVNENNVYKVSKIIHLAFKSSEYEQELFYLYLCNIFLKYGS